MWHNLYQVLFQLILECEDVIIYQRNVSWVRCWGKFIFEGSKVIDRTLFKVYRVWYQMNGKLNSNMNSDIYFPNKYFYTILLLRNKPRVLLIMC